MSFQIRIGLIIVLPLLLMTAVVAWVIQAQSSDFLAEQSHLLRQSLRSSKQNALRDYVELAETALQPILTDPALDEASALQEARRILSAMTFGEHGYFFLYDAQGVNLVHPRKPELEGQNLWQWQDSQGKWVIQDLLQASLRQPAQQRFEDYFWQKESSAQPEAPKLGYVTRVGRWQWMLGTGLYMDDVEREEWLLEQQVDANVWKNLTIIVWALGLTTFLIFLLMLFVNVHEGRLANRRLQVMAYNFVNLQVQERRRFSHELHDGINQLLVAVKYRIELGLKQANKASGQHQTPLQHSLELLDQAILEMRRISHALRPGLLDELGLEQALEHLITQFSERTHIHVKRTYHCAEALADEIEITFYRVIQEGLTNIERHAQATQVDVQLVQHKDRVYLQLRDNGCGFIWEQVKAQAGIGLSNMRERVELLGGSFQLDTRPGQGTLINAMLPLKMS